jgi:pyruvate dehydrogenase E2 component (dihydrolipoamide acetyltransferase)
MGISQQGIALPRLGATMEEGRVTEWLVAPWPDFARGDVLMRVETNNNVFEVPALLAGRKAEHLALVGLNGTGRPSRITACGGPARTPLPAPSCTVRTRSSA